MNSGNLVSKATCKTSAFLGMLLVFSVGNFSGAAAAVFAGPVSFAYSDTKPNSLDVSFRPALWITEIDTSTNIYHHNVNLTGGNLIFNFDVVDNWETTGSYTYGYSAIFNTFGVTRVSLKFDNERSSADIKSTSSGKTYSGGQSYTENTVGVYGPVDYDFGGGVISHSFFDITDTTRGYFGSFSVIVPLSQADLNVFNTGNPARFEFSLSGDNVTLRDVVARVTYDLDNPSPTFRAPPEPTAAIPEPSTWALLTLGFSGLGAMLRRRLPAPLPQA